MIEVRATCEIEADIVGNEERVIGEVRGRREIVGERIEGGKVGRCVFFWIKVSSSPGGDYHFVRIIPASALSIF